MKRNFFNLTKDTYEKPTANIILNDARLNYSSLRSEQCKDVFSQQYYSAYTGGCNSVIRQ